MGECIKFGRGVLKKTEVLMIYDGGSALLNGTLIRGEIDSSSGKIAGTGSSMYGYGIVISDVDYTQYNKLCFEGYGYISKAATISVKIGLGAGGATAATDQITFSDYVVTMTSDSSTTQYDFEGETNISGASDGYSICAMASTLNHKTYITKLWLEG